jgi:SNF2-related domain
VRKKSELRDGQQNIITELYNNDEKIVVLRPGGGKTAATLTAQTELFRDNVIRHALVTAPKRVARSVWPDEIAGWEHARHLRYAVLDGGPNDRVERLKAYSRRELTIFGHDIIDWMLDYLTDIPDDHPFFDLLVIDEISRFRNQKGERYKKLIKHVHRWRMIWGLSGTLRPASGLDLFCPVRLVTRGKLWGRSFYQWQKENFYPLDYDRHQWDFKPHCEDKINAEIAPLVVTAEVPVMPEPTIILDRITLPEKARVEYRKMERKLFADIGVTDDGDPERVIAGTKAIATGKLAQIANGFVYDTKKVGEKNVTSVIRLHEEKSEWMQEIVASAAAPTLLIYEFTEDFDIIKQIVGKDFRWLGAGVSDKQAAKNIDDWNAGRLPFMGLHPASGGHGLNLQFGGSDMAWMAPTWDSELWDQTLARLARPGQTRQVMVRVCVANDTVDEMKLDRVHYKLSGQAAFEKYLQRIREAA